MSTSSKIPEPSFNLMLAGVLQRKHPDWPKQLVAENIRVLSSGKGKKPDIVLNTPSGVPVVVETEYMPARTVEADALGRLGETLSANGRPIEQVIAVRIPRDLQDHRPDEELVAAIDEAVFEFCLFSYDGYDKDGQPKTKRWPDKGWIQGGVDDLATCIELTALSENRLTEGLDVLERGISQAAERLREACPLPPLKKIAEYLHQEDGDQTSRMAMAIVANAFTFHRAIAGTQNEDGTFTVETIDELRNADWQLPKGSILKHWNDILTKINYWPIFKIASDILLPVPNGTARDVIDILAKVSEELTRLGITSQHDLGGRMFQEMITDRKFLATFYTLPSSAALLAELAVERLDADLTDPDALCRLRIADFACGTGALLSAAYAGLRGRHRRRNRDDSVIHARMMESVLVGTDIMPAAAHLTASMLSSAHPGTPFLNTSIVTLPYGEVSEEMAKATGGTHAIGALDLIEKEASLPLFQTSRERLRGRGRAKREHVDMPHGGFDLVIMNPPFTSPTNHALSDVPVPSFAGFATSEEEQRIMSNRLKRIVRGLKAAHRAAVKGDPNLPEIILAGHGNAGLGSNFMDLVHAKIRNPGGVIALILSASFLQGAAWANARRLLEAHYKDIVVASIAATGTNDYAFSADTDMGEVMIVATRRGSEEPGPGQTLFVNLLHRPKTILEAATVARAVKRVPHGLAAGPIMIGTEERAGCIIRETLSNAGCAGLSEANAVVQAAAGLGLGQLKLPRRLDAMPIPLAQLGALGDRGLLHRDINGLEEGIPRGPFDIVKGEARNPIWPVLWGHDAVRETQMTVLPDSVGEVRPGYEADAHTVWERTASRLHFNLEFRLTSQPLAACMTPNLSIGGRAWPNFRCEERQWETPLVLWSNTTLGLMAFWWIGNRQQQGRANLTISKLPSLTVLDARELTSAQLNRADAIFDEFRNRELLPANEAWRDGTRQALDHAVLVDLLGLPEDIMEPLDLLRLQWCAEPSVHGGKSTRPPEGG